MRALLVLSQKDLKTNREFIGEFEGKQLGKGKDASSRQKNVELVQFTGVGRS